MSVCVRVCFAVSLQKKLDKQKHCFVVPGVGWVEGAGCMKEEKI